MELERPYLSGYVFHPEGFLQGFLDFGIPCPGASSTLFASMCAFLCLAPCVSVALISGRGKCRCKSLIACEECEEWACHSRTHACPVHGDGANSLIVHFVVSPCVRASSRGVGDIPTQHDVGRLLAVEIVAPLTSGRPLLAVRGRHAGICSTFSVEAVGHKETHPGRPSSTTATCASKSRRWRAAAWPSGAQRGHLRHAVHGRGQVCELRTGRRRAASLARPGCRLDRSRALAPLACPCLRRRCGARRGSRFPFPLIHALLTCGLSRILLAWGPPHSAGPGCPSAGQPRLELQIATAIAEPTAGASHQDGKPRLVGRRQGANSREMKTHQHSTTARMSRSHRNFVAKATAMRDARTTLQKTLTVALQVQATSEKQANQRGVATTSGSR